MITVTAEFLDEKWMEINSAPFVPVSFSSWDNGDALTLSSIGPTPSSRVVYGAITKSTGPVSDFPIVIRLTKADSQIQQPLYTAPDGVGYILAAEQRIDGKEEQKAIKLARLRIDISARRAGLLETDALKNKTVTIVGLGTGGSQIALELAKCGVGKFILIDPDRLEIGNVSRHAAGISFVGRKKVFAMKDLILEKNPDASVEALPILSDRDSEEAIQAAIQQSDVVIGATDSRPSKLFLNELCVKANKKVIFAGAHRRAYGGLVLRVRPHESACFHCFVLAMPDTEADREVSSQEDADQIAYSDRPVTVEPGLSLDVLPIALMASKLALQELIVGQQSTLHVLDKDLAANWYFWINRPEPGTNYASWPPLSESVDEMTILRWYGVHLEKDSGCPSCGDFEKAARERYSVDARTSAAISTGPLSSTDN